MKGILKIWTITVAFCCSFTSVILDRAFGNVKDPINDPIMIPKDKYRQHCSRISRKIALALQRLEVAAATVCILAASVNAGRYDPAYPGMENRIQGGGAAYFPEQSNKVAAEIGSKVVIPCKILNLTNEST